MDARAPFSEAEAAAAVRLMNRCSAPGPDGFGPSFYKAAWSTVEVQVMDLLGAFHRNEVDLERINRAYMVLLPKKPGCVSVDSFRPISLQNCSLKIITKILTTRLQREIASLIDLDQTGFIRGRSITENFVYAMELVQCCHKRKTPTLVLKLDFAKAFDTVSWDGLATILSARGFCDVWLSWMKKIQSTSRNAVLVNGCSGPWFTCRRGLRQGDPLSPYLFLLVADVLQVLIKNSGMVRHPILEDSACPILQYADDTLILARANIRDIMALKHLLDSFSAASGLQINYSKSTAVPMHVNPQDLAPMLQVLGCKQEGFPQTYLGLPLSSTKLRLTAFSPQIAKTDKYLGGWQAALLNPTGRAVLVNSVLDSQLVYAMCAVPLPPGILSRADSRRRSFLWTGEDRCSGSSCLVAWENVCKPKQAGGLGIKDLHIQNTCLLVKLIHRLHSSALSSWAAWVRSNVKLATMEGEIRGCHWDTLRALLPIYQATSSSQVGDGCSTDFWHDAWSGPDDLSTAFPALYSHCIRQKVCVMEVVLQGLHLVPRLTPQAQEELEAVLTIVNNTSLADRPDTRHCFLADHTGNFQTSTLYNLLKGSLGHGDVSTTFIWGNKAPPRAQFFCWLLMQGKIQCKWNLKKKGIVDDDCCEICNQDSETPSHIIFHCPFARQFWSSIGFSVADDLGTQDLPNISRPDRLPGAEFNSFVLLCCWQLWKRRNGVVFRQDHATLAATLHSCASEAKAWAYRHNRKEAQVLGAWLLVFSNPIM